MALFDLNKIDTAPQETRRLHDAKLARYFEVHSYKVKNIEELIDQIPKPGEVFFLWTENSFNTVTFLTYLVALYEQIEEVVISTYSMNRKVIDALAMWLKSGNIQSLHITLADSMHFRMPKVMDHLNAQIEEFKNRFTIRYSWNHSKVTLVKAGKDRLIIEGSGNFSDNARIEQYIFLNNPEVFAFRENWIKNVPEINTNR